jgi:hypothetical protein
MTATYRTSERITFKKCRTLWEFTSQNRMSLEPVRMNKNLSFGIAVHIGLEYYYNPDTWDYLDDQSKTEIAVAKFNEEMQRQLTEEKKANLGSVTTERQKEFDELVQLGVGMLRHYGEWAPERDRELGLVPVAVEEAIKVPIGEYQGEPVYYQARIDMVARHGDGSLWLWDHKTAAYVSGDHTFLDIDTQITSYFWIYEQAFGELPKGMMYNELAKKVPEPPKQLKNGGLSQDKRQATTLSLYVEEIDRLGLDSEPYSAMLNYLAAKEEDYFLRTQVTRTIAEIETQARYIKAEVVDMLYDPSIYPNPSKMYCNTCDFRAPCTIRNEGGDDMFLLGDSSLYRKRESEEVTVE